MKSYFVTAYLNYPGQSLFIKYEDLGKTNVLDYIFISLNLY